MAKNRRAVRALSVTLAIVGTAACGNPVNGAAMPAASASGPASRSDNPFASLNQCQLVDQILAGQGFPPAQPSVADSKRSCRSMKRSQNSAINPATEIGIALQNGQNYTENIQNPNSAHEGNVGGRKLIEQRDLLGSPGGCQIGMDVGPNARALVIVLIGDDTAAACKKAEDAATALDKLLPRS